MSKLQYGLESVWLNQCERKRLDAFHCKCIRRILKIKHSYYSRISNAQVLTSANEEPLSVSVLKQQLMASSRIAVSNSTHQLRSLIFDGGHTFGKFDFHPRPVGMPKQCWVDEIYKIVLSICCSVHDIGETFRQCSDSLTPWADLVKQHCVLLSFLRY